LTAKIEPGWRLYAPTTPGAGQGNGPPLTKIELSESVAVANWKAFQPQPTRKHDPNFDLESEIYTGEVTFLYDIELKPDATEGEATLEASAFYSVCDDRFCLRPVLRKTPAVLQVAALDPSASQPVSAPSVPAGYEEAKPRAASDLTLILNKDAPAAAPGSEGLLQFAAVAFGFGLLAIFTPCVFPMIPITMSYFVSTQTGERKASFVQATVFCVGVIVLFTGIGALVSVILGPFGTVQLGSNVWVNLFIAFVFFAFAASLFGAFEISIPSGAMTRLNKVSGRGGILGTLLMGLVFALASFACTGPLIGPLLASSIQGGLAWPIFGMAMFSTGMALPFFGLALFPAYISKLPRSGSWLIRIKRTMAFLILAVAFKYLSNVDLMYQLQILTRERFLAIWIVLFGLCGFYLLGMLRLPDEADDRPGLPRLGLGVLVLFLAVSLVPGMLGGRLGEIDAYVPPVEYSGLGAASLAGGGGDRVPWLKDDYQKALTLAREQGKTVLVSFTGYACTNCHWMKANMFTKPEIVEVTRNLVLVELYTDGADEASKVNQELQLTRFRTTAIPHYAIIRPDETIVAEFPGRTRDAEAFRKFLRSGA
jgi:thiol:disulfide interchange protein DsbD